MDLGNDKNILELLAAGIDEGRFGFVIRPKYLQCF